MTGDFYSPKKHGISATPTKVMSGSYTPNYVPSNYMANHPTEHVASALVQGGPWSPVRYAQYTPPKLGSTLLFREKALRNFGYNISFIV